uniref:dolichyl-diphosphooligosaccharide--protein glycotransferase n=1 Tax=Aureoumbra lagunensis TaxID=44058 RepID=A0A7S3JR16_9STRA
MGEYVGIGVRVLLLLLAASNAYNIRMYAIRIYGNVIHEFDPWFNYRATDYLANNGWKKFFTWFDHRAWYPLGRPVGTTIYPGMQIVSVLIWRILNEWLGYEMSLNDVCVYVPVWFGVCATMLLGWLTYECSRSVNAAVAATLIMAVIPAHLMRSVGGGYDNESVAMTAMCLTFGLWCRSLRNDDAWPIGALAGFAYVFMVAAWGGFIFVLNMIGAHCALLILFGRYNSSLHKAYSLWYIIGTLGATRVPVVGLSPLRSLEQLAPGALFLGMQLLEFCEQIRKRKKLNFVKAWTLRFQVFGGAGIISFFIGLWLLSKGYFGPLSARVRGLFVKHTRTGNPLVDSVAEHQPASSNAYWHYLHYTMYAAPIGMMLIIFFKRSNGALFITLYGCFAYFFSSKMVRLIIFLGPVASALAGVALGTIVETTTPLLVDALFGGFGGALSTAKDKTTTNADTTEDKASGNNKNNKKSTSTPLSNNKIDENEDKKRTTKAARKPPSVTSAKAKSDNTMIAKILKSCQSAFIPIHKNYKQISTFINALIGTILNICSSPRLRIIRTVIAAALLAAAVHYYKQFSDYAWSLAEGMSQPSIMFRAHLRDGTPVMVDDYREAYWWLRDNTPHDARVMAWWDYGYQISGIANRTTIADGNTWNHEHIATLGRCLTSPEKQAHRIVRHLADYVLVWTGGGGDDLAKSPHMARIGNSVFRDMCGDDPTCSRFGFIDRHGTPTPMMAESLLYKLHSHNQRPGVRVDPNLFREVHTSRFNKVRIYKVLQVSKKSKAWNKDPKNRICDVPGSWYCVGQYPPALKPLIERRINFAQLEDFNKQRDAHHDEYVKSYMERMDGRHSSTTSKRGSKKKLDEPRPFFDVPWEADDEDGSAAAAAKKAKAEAKKKEKEAAAAAKENEQATANEEQIDVSSESVEDPPTEDEDDDEDFEEYDHEEAAREAEQAAQEALRMRQAEWPQWSNSEDTTQMWALISQDRLETIEQWISYAPSVVKMRAADGRGPLWWAYEYDRPEIIDLLISKGADAEATDALGMKPKELAPQDEF